MRKKRHPASSDSPLTSVPEYDQKEIEQEEVLAVSPTNIDDVPPSSTVIQTEVPQPLEAPQHG
jgi:hypothetical protein